MKNPALLEEIKTYKGRDEVPEDFDIFWDEEVKKFQLFQTTSWRKEISTFLKSSAMSSLLKQQMKARSMHASFFQRVRESSYNLPFPWLYGTWMGLG